jgi:hypothetical protein
MADVGLAVRRLLDAYPWAGSTPPLQLLGFDVVMRADDARVVDLLTDLYAPLSTGGGAGHVLSLRSTAAGGRQSFELHLDGVRLLRAPAASIAFRHLLFEANQQAIEQTTDLVLVHASAVARDGKAVVVPGPMGAGKSTLAAVLVQAGLAYLTDELVALDPGAGMIRAYPKYLSVGPALASLASVPPAMRSYVGDDHLVAPRALGAVAAAAEPAVVILPRYERGAATVLEAIPAAEAFPSVARHAFHLERDGERVLATVAAMVARSSCYTLVSGDPLEARDAVLAVLA